MEKRSLEETEAVESESNKRVKVDAGGRFDYLKELIEEGTKELSKVQVQVVGLLQKGLSKPPAEANAWAGVELGDAKGLSLAIEAEVATLFHPERNTDEYKTKIKTLSFNLGKNEDLRGNVLSGEITVEALCSMDVKEMQTQKMRLMYEELAKEVPSTPTPPRCNCRHNAL